MPTVPNWRAELNGSGTVDRYVQTEVPKGYIRPVANINANASGQALSNFGKALTGAGNTGLGIAADIITRSNNAFCQEQVAKFERMYTQEQNLLSQRKGKDALKGGLGEGSNGVYLDSQQWFRETTDNLMGACANGAQKQYLANYFNRRGTAMESWALGHEDRQRASWEESAFKGQVDAQMASAMSDPSRMDEALSEIAIAVKGRAISQGQDAQYATAQVRKYRDQLVIGAMQQAYQTGDPDRALAIYRQYGGQVSATSRGQLQQALDSGVVSYARQCAAAGDYGGARSVLTHYADVAGSGSASSRNLANNNFGNVKAAGGGYQSYATREDGLMGVGERILRYMDAPDRGWHATTIREMVEIYAPASDGNNPGEYASFLAKRLGVGPDDKVDFRDRRILAGLIKSMPVMEHGANKVHITDEEALRAADRLLAGEKPALGRPAPAGQGRASTMARIADLPPAVAGAAVKIAGQALGADLWSQYGEAGNMQRGYEELEKVGNPVMQSEAMKLYRAKEQEQRHKQKLAADSELADAQKLAAGYRPDGTGTTTLEQLQGYQLRHKENAKAIQAMFRAAIYPDHSPMVSDPTALREADEFMLSGGDANEIIRRYTGRLASSDMESLVKTARTKNEKLVKSARTAVFDGIFKAACKPWQDAGSNAEKDSIYNTRKVQFLELCAQEKNLTVDRMRALALQVSSSYSVETEGFFGGTSMEDTGYAGYRRAISSGSRAHIKVPDKFRDLVDAEYERRHGRKPNFTDQQYGLMYMENLETFAREYPDDVR